MADRIRRSEPGSRALIALLLFVLLLAAACGGSPGNPNAEISDERRERIEEAAQGRLAPPEEKTEGATTVETVKVAAQDPPPAPFVHRATPENSRGTYTYLDEPRINGDPNAVVFASPKGAYDRNIGVWYEAGKRRWAIFNQDRASVAPGSTFEVVVPEESERFVHTYAKADDTSSDKTYLDDPLVNDKPDADVSVTQNWNPGGGGGVYNDHPVDARYDADRGRWVVFNEDGADLSDGVAFNVTVSEEAQTGGGEVAAVDTGEAPEYRDFYSEGDPETPEKLISSGSSAGAIPVVQPFNFGRDPGGPEDKTLSIDIPRIGVEGVPVYDTASEEKLRDGTVHIPASGYPWQEGANVFIAGHRIGYEGTPSYYVFFRLDELGEGDEIRLTDAAGDRYLYRVTKTTVVGPDSVGVMNAVEGRSLVTLQTCTLPDYDERLIVQGELVRNRA